MKRLIFLLIILILPLYSSSLVPVNSEMIQEITDSSIPLIISFTLVSIVFFIFSIKLFLSSRSVKVVTGMEEMIGSTAEVIESKERTYLIRCHSEMWSATSEDTLIVGQKVQVIELSGLILKVKPIEE